MKAMILAAGLGTRLKPWTDKHPKALAVVNGKSLLQRNIEYLQGFDIYEVVVNVHHFAAQIIHAVTENKGWGSKIIFSDETGEVLETGGGLKKAEPLLTGENFVLMNADILTNLNLKKMIRQHIESEALATLAVTHRESSRQLLFDNDNLLCGWRNNSTNEVKGRDGDAKAFSGIHVISTQIFPLISESGKFSMIDLYLRLCTTQKIIGFDHSGGVLIDVGKPEAIAKAEQFFN